MESRVRVGQRFVGRGQFDGWRFTVTDVTPETEDFAGLASIWVDQQPPCLLTSTQGTIDYYRKHNWDGAQARADEIERAVTQPRQETRELEWFAQWLKRGLIAEAEDSPYAAKEAT